MIDETPRPVFRPPTDWEAVYAAHPDEHHFGQEPSQLARTALRWFEAFGGEAERSVALDLGSGEGRDTAYLASAGFQVEAYDLAPTGLEKTRRLLVRQGVLRERVALTQGDVRDFAYPAGAYDLALAANVFQFLPPDEAPAHIRRLTATVRPGGLCAVGVFHPDMRGWGADLDGLFAASGADLMGYFPAEDGWLTLDRTEYWTYVLPQAAMASFAYVIARKVSPQP